MKKLSQPVKNRLLGFVEDNSIWIAETEEEYIQGPPKEIVAQLSRRQLNSIYNFGKKSLKETIDWLAEDGLSLKQELSETDKKKIDSAIKLLRSFGYTVSEP